MSSLQSLAVNQIYQAVVISDRYTKALHGIIRFDRMSRVIRRNSKEKLF